MDGSNFPRSYNKVVKLYPGPWKHGNLIVFEIRAVGGREEFFLCQRCFWDRDHPQFRLDMGLLSGGEARGFYADGLAYKLFKELFMPTDEYKAEFPESVTVC